MNKYLTLTGLAFQKQLEVRSDFIFERIRSLSVMVSLYFLWTAILAKQSSVLGYSREQILTYVLMATLMRALVLGAVTDYIPQEIAKGKLSEVLLRPISHMGYWAAQDVAAKMLNLVSAVIELTVFTALVSASFYTPAEWVSWVGFALSLIGGMIIYFQLSYLMGVMGFWTAQSWGPRFCFEVVLEFCGGAYFPLDVLPSLTQRILSVLPFPYLVFYPLSIFLERSGSGAILHCLMMQVLWIGILSILVRYFWRKGLKFYAAEGR